MKFKDTDEFLEACNYDKLIKPLIDNGCLAQIKKADLQELNIKPGIDGFYSYGNVFDLYCKLKDRIKNEKGDLALQRAVIDSEYKDSTDEYEQFKIIKLIEPESPTVKRFLLATLSDDFGKEIRKIRQRYYIPTDGFNTKTDKDSYTKWDSDMREKAENELVNKTYRDYVEENRRSGFIFGEKNAYSDNIFTSLGKLKKETYDLFWKYNIRVGFIPHLYIRYDLSNISIVSFLNSENDASPFQVSTKWTFSDGEKTSSSWSNPNKFGIFIDRPVSKEALIEYVENSETLKNQLNDYYHHVELNENMQRDWLIYKYYKLDKYPQKDIPTILNDYGFNDVTKSVVKTTIYRMKERITKFEEVTE